MRLFFKTVACVVGLGILIAAIFIAFLTLLPPNAGAQVQPLDDPNGQLTAAERGQLTDRLMANWKATGVSIVVWLPNLDKDAVLLDAAVDYFKAKGIGAKGQDNGVLILVDFDHRRGRIEVGYGLEGVMTDAATKSIQDNVMAPHFKKGDKIGGLLAGVDALGKLSEAWKTGDKVEPVKRPDMSAAVLFMIVTGTLAVVFFVAYVWLSAVQRARREEEDRQRRQRAREAEANRQAAERERRLRDRTVSPASFAAGLAGGAVVERMTNYQPTRRPPPPAPKPSPKPASAYDVGRKRSRDVGSSYTSSWGSSDSGSSSSSSSDSGSSSYSDSGGSSGGGGSDSSW
jgi:uncharacterized membrane protein YgcG